MISQSEIIINPTTNRALHQAVPGSSSRSDTVVVVSAVEAMPVIVMIGGVRSSLMLPWSRPSILMIVP